MNIAVKGSQERTIELDGILTSVGLSFTRLESTKNIHSNKFDLIFDLNFDDDASIISSWDRIKVRAVDNLPTRMPSAPNAALTNQDKQKITDWVNAGHRTTD